MTLCLRQRSVARSALAMSAGNGREGSPDSPLPIPKRKAANQVIWWSSHTRTVTVRCATDNPVHPQTEGNKSLPNEAPTTPRLLGAINGTPRRMEQYIKHTLSTLQLRDSITTPPKCSREIWAHFLSRYSVVLFLCSLLCICVCCCCIVLLCVYSTPSLTPVFRLLSFV
jgi:hypothetical protein